MPVLTLVGRNVCGETSPFVLNAFLKKDKSVRAPDGTVLIELDAELEHVLRIRAESVAAGETFTHEQRIDALDLRDAQWATEAALSGRFELTSLKWGDHELLREPGILR